MKCADVNVNLGAFVLGGLEPEETEEVRRHLALCSSCRNELAELEEINPALEAAPRPADPPRHLKGAILTRMRAEKPHPLQEEEATSSSPMTPPDYLKDAALSRAHSEEPPPSEESSSFKKRRFVIMPAAAAVLVVGIALGVFLSSWESDRAVATADLTPTEAGEEYWGVAEVYPQPPGNELVELKLNDLDEPGPGSFYEVRFVSGEKYISAGSFTVTGSGETKVWLSVPHEAQSYHTLLIVKKPVDEEPTASDEEVLRGEVSSQSS